MSRLTASPFHKPSPFDFLPSPPETHSDTLTGLPPHMLPQNLAVHDLGITDSALPGPSPDTPSRGKRSSSIPFHSATFREVKDRGSQRTGKSLIIVVPPSTLIQEHGQHGHTLSNGPYHRLSQGVVMPLFPSLFGQLTAIAREFNFPSTSGLCLYLHYVEDGFTLTPRITEDSWQTLWGHLAEPPRPNEHRPLIGGKVEFDIDLRLARWYTNWLSSIYREISDYPNHSYPATAPSVAHFRRESSLSNSRQYEDESGENPAVQQHSAPVGRHVPRKLSLVERFDVSTGRPEARVNPRSVGTPPELAASVSHTLSTIVQEEEPQTARRHLDHRVNSWRANAIISPVPLAATGQTSLDPVNLPNNMSIDSPVGALASPVEEEMRLEDYAWSVSSIGPQSPLEILDSYWSPAPSVHLASRLEGSVLLTPSTCTTFGHYDEDYVSLASEPFSRLPSPDIAQRFYEDCPPTPMTATSWGAPLSYPPSPRCVSPVPSVDIGERCMDDLLTYPTHQHAHLPGDIGTSEKPWSHVWPYTDREEPLDSSSVRPWSHVWPYNATPAREPSSVLGVSLQAIGYPYLDIYRPVYPHLEIYPAIPGNMKPSLTQKVDRTSSAIRVQVPSGYPIFDLYPAVYPYNLESIYPSVLQAKEKSSSSVEGYPYFNIYPAIRPPFFTYLSLYICVPPAQYPDLTIYPEVTTDPLAISEPTSSAQSAKSPYRTAHAEGYPVFNIYPAVYPYFDLYPAVTVRKSLETDHQRASPVLYEGRSQRVHLQTYPVFNIYPAVYPHFDLYPSVSPSSELKNSQSSKQWVTPTVIYPRFNLYPAVYPYFDIYPAVTVESVVRENTIDQALKSSLSVQPPPSYPFFNLYPSQYPYLEIYPVAYGSGVQTDGVQKPIKSTLFSGYPFFNLYPGVYPHLDIYPAPYSLRVDITPQESNLSSQKLSGPSSSTELDSHAQQHQASSSEPVRKSRNSSRLTHAELHAMVMMEKRGSFGHIEPIPALQEHGVVHTSPNSVANEDSELLRHVRQSSASSLARGIYGSPAPSSSDPRRLSLTRGGPVPKVPNKPEILRSSSLREQANLRSYAEREASRSSSLRESSPKSSFPLPPKPAPRRRDSLVLQRVKAFDHEAESSSGLSKETLAKFPMPPGAPRGFPPLPPVPANR